MRRAVAKGKRSGDEEGVVEAYREEERVGSRSVWRPERVVSRGCGCEGGSVGNAIVDSRTAIGGSGELAGSGMRDCAVMTGETDGAVSKLYTSKLLR